MRKSLVAITGASSGIGLAIAKTFSKAGYPVALIARNLSAMTQLNLPDSICQSVDVTNYEQFRTAIFNAENKFGQVDCLINNAGIFTAGKFETISENDHRNIINVNFLGVIHGILTVLPGMQKRNSGTIINVSSSADRKARPNYATYAATKAAVRSLTESLRMANARHQIRICNLAPAKIRTSLVVGLEQELNIAINPKSLAKTALWIYEQPQSICIRDLVFAPTLHEK